MQFYGNLIHKILTLIVTILYSTASKVFKIPLQGLIGLLLLISVPPPAQLRSYLFFLPLKNSIKYKFTPEECGFTPEGGGCGLNP